MEYSNDMLNPYRYTEDYNPDRKRKVLIVFDDMIADMINNKILNAIVTELFIRGRKLNISIAFIIVFLLPSIIFIISYFRVPIDLRLDSTHFLL